jgi:hypothetical protein
MEFIDLLLNYFIGAIFCIITIGLVTSFVQDKKGHKDLVLLQMTLQIFLVPMCINFLVHHSFLENMRYGIHRRRLKPAAIYS